jgi:hypothetical protein
MEEAKIKGSVMRDPRDWMRKDAYGPEAYQAALAKLRPEEQAVIDGPIFPTGWYPVEVWDRFQDAMRNEALARKGHTAKEFNDRNMREAGSVVVRGIYRLVVGVLNTRRVIETGVSIYRRAYNSGRCEALENAPGRAVVRYGGANPALRTNLVHNFSPGLVYLLEMNGAHNVKSTITRDEVVDGKLEFDVTLTYEE